ncbi:hypothetical protein ACTA71_000303 [Dictyostelium dimigraforme]
MNRNLLLFLFILLSLLLHVNGQFQIIDLSSNSDKIKYIDSGVSTCNFKIPILVHATGLSYLSEDTIPSQWLPYSSNSSDTLFLTEFNSVQQGSKNFSILVNGLSSSGSIQISLTCLSFFTILSFGIIKPVFWSSTLKYSSILSIIGLPNGINTFNFDKSSFNILILDVISSTTYIRVEFNENYYFANKGNSTWPINLGFKGTNYTLKIPFISPKIDLDLPVDIQTFSTKSTDIDFMGDIFGEEITFRSVSSNQRPVYSLSTQFNNSKYYVSPRPIYGNANNITYIVYCRRLTSGIQVYSLNSFLKSSIDISLSTTSKFYNTKSIFNNQSPFIVTNNQTTGTLFDLSFSNLKSYDFQTYQFQFKPGSSKMNLAFPFGFKSGNNSMFNYSASFLTSFKSNSLTSSLMVDNIPFQISTNQLVSTTDNLYIGHLEIVKVGFFKYIIRVLAGSSVGVKYFIIPLKSGSIIKIDNSNSVSQNIILGIWELIFDIFEYGSDYKGNIIVYNLQDQQVSYSLGYPFDMTNVSNKLSLPTIDLSNNNYLQDITNISFLYNNIDLTNQNVDNIIYFSFGDANGYYSSTDIAFSLTDPKSLRDQEFNGDISKYYKTKLSFAKWDSSKNRFSAPFKMPANTVPGQLDYTIIFDRDNIIPSTILPMEYQLNVTCSNVDIQGPIITNIIYNYNPSFNDAVSFGWTITIEDSINGFDNGYIIIRGIMDSSLYNVSISSKNGKNGNKLKDNYDVLIELDRTHKCISQNYSITYVYLVDTFGNEATFYRHSTDIQLKKEVYSYDSTGNPLINFINQQSLLSIPSPQYCNSTQSSSTFSLVNFTTNITQMDSGIKDRSITFNFEAQDTTGLKKDQYPIVYLISQDFKSSQCISKIMLLDDVKGVYQCTFDQLPLGFGYPNGLSVSVYGFINNGGQFFGFSSTMLNSSGFQNYIKVPYYNPNEIMITGTTEFNEFSSEFLIYGTAFSLIYSIKATLSNGTQIECTFQFYFNSILRIYNFPTGIKDPFTLIGNGISNVYTVTPIQYNFNYQPIITETPTVTYPPQKCKGSPECGGASNGYCSSSGCVCYSPWFGIDCTSQIVTVPPPSIDTDKPITSIYVPNNSNGNNISSIISIVALREINSVTNEQIKIHYLEKWVYNNISSTISQYKSNITNDDETTTTTIVATLEWFTESKNISFANEKLTMNPSSMKYTIELSSYPFANALSNLQVVMSAQIQSSEKNDICTDKDFGNTTMENSNYIKLQVASNSFYGRYIKRGILDGKIVTVENEILDSKFNSIQSENTAQTYIGILIGRYVNYATIDPDFSVLIESNKANSDSPNSICSAISNSKQLSAGQLVGIIIGSFIGFLTLLIIVVFLMYKSQHCLFVKIIIYKIKRKSKL